MGMSKADSPLYADRDTAGPPRDLEAVRQQLAARGLREADLDPDPFRQFRAWYDAALAAQIRLADAMTLATATAQGKPSARMVLLKGFDDRGFVFFTNFESRKGRDLADNPQAALVVYWKEFDRQVRIEGSVERTTPEESDRYFRSRPWASQVSACASRQSTAIAGREVLERRTKELIDEHPDGKIPRPAFWGGYRVVPTEIEFWQGRPNRLHDRLCYRRSEDGHWVIERLSP
jgi:pyridoxamine 5'-phosphate oxidase